MQDDKSNLLILLSSDQTIPTNAVRLDVLQDVFIEFSEVKISGLCTEVRLVFWPTGQNINLTVFINCAIEQHTVPVGLLHIYT